mmetsp:Transcript_84605/g.237947  ORF Transcript_84605/g.237947 Transcript_84605/m.237947 type:complete len:588 (+) Transcript_84605:1-1764(+)
MGACLALPSSQVTSPDVTFGPQQGAAYQARPAPTQSQDASAPPGLPMVNVQCPANMAPGAKLYIVTPEGFRLEAFIPPGISAGQSFGVQYDPAALAVASANMPGQPSAPPQASVLQNPQHGARTSGFGFLNQALGTAQQALTQANEVVAARTGRKAEEWVQEARTQAYAKTVNLRTQISSQMESALANADNSKVSALLDSAMAAKLLDGRNAPASIRRAADQVASRQLQEAIASEDPRRLKGALIAANRLNATHLPEFAAAAQTYQKVKKLPPGWDVSKMVLHRQGDKMVAKTDIEDPAVLAKFQRLLDITHRKVYTRDRMGDAVPERLQLLKVHVVTNDDLWANYMARREWVRRDLEADPAGFERYNVETTDTLEDSVADGGEAAESIAETLAAEFGEPLRKDVNETFLFHGTTKQAADSITTSDFRLNLAGTNAGTLYGRGVYFAENASKSDEYTRPDTHNLRYMLLCRTLLGRAYYLDQKDADPRACEEACLRGKFHSVLGDRKKARGTFREFIVFDEEQVYPNYILVYRRVDPQLDPARTLTVQVPLGAAPGTILQVTAPNGQTLQVVVPAGCAVGQTFSMQY